MKITRELFDEWLANPVTEAVLKTVAQNAQDNKAAWLASSWDTGQADQAKLTEMRARADAADDLSKFEFDDLLEEMKDDGK